MKGFEDFALAPDILAAVRQQGYCEPTQIQSAVIPLVLDGKDILAAARTGTGKTAAFILPLLQLRLAAKEAPPAVTVDGEVAAGTKLSSGAPSVLIVTPTRELARQIGDCCTTYGQNIAVSSLVVGGGVAIQPQIQALRAGVDILIGTPGRLLDLIERHALDLGSVCHLVLDEADRMLDMGFIKAVERLLELLPEEHQTLLFSATYSKKIKKLAGKILHEPEIIEVSPPNTTAELVRQSAYYVANADKVKLLSHLITAGNWRRVLVFARTRASAELLAEDLMKRGISAAAIHGDKNQKARNKTLDQFKDERFTVLVATDVRARGLSIPQLPYVVNYELPNQTESYIHRIGRTGRAGSPGEAISLVSPGEKRFLKAIEAKLRKGIYIRKNYEYPITAPQRLRQGKRSVNSGTAGVCKKGKRGKKKIDRPPLSRAQRLKIK